MKHLGKRNLGFHAATIVMVICYTFSFPLFNHLNEQPVGLSKIILHLQDSKRVHSTNTSIDNHSAHSDTITILKSIACTNIMQLNTDDTSQDTIIVELQTPHILYAGNESAVTIVQQEQVNFHTVPYISVNSPPDTPPPIKLIA